MQSIGSNGGTDLECVGSKREMQTPKFFHPGANGRRRKNHIPSLIGNMREVRDHSAKADILLAHFKSRIGTQTERSRRLNWEFLGLPSVGLPTSKTNSRRLR
jgi:hypothetical protein